MTACHLTKLIDMIAPEWPANSYNLISRNCNHFVDFFLAQIACRRQLPPFVNRCSRLAVSVKCCLPRFIIDMNFISPLDVCVPCAPKLIMFSCNFLSSHPILIGFLGVVELVMISHAPLCGKRKRIAHLKAASMKAFASTLASLQAMLHCQET